MKSEPTSFSFEDLKKSENKTTHWDGVRNYQARNFMMKDMKIGDEVLFYHSNCDVPGVVGLAYVSSEPYPDFTAFDKNSKYYDPKSTPEKPRWFMVDITWKADFKRIVSLKEIKSIPELSSMKLVQKGQSFPFNLYQKMNLI
jgi:predicted RNA-binding protein with PUA-like domain